MDLSLARQLRMMAAEFKERANRAKETMPAFMVKPNGRDSGDIDPQN
ncbi:MAG: hypothetical protein M5U07_11780 [Xanthobacteraceae bacterium]|nr:hypothetical protein [Xanthobacteraceae bacterium]